MKHFPSVGGVLARVARCHASAFGAALLAAAMGVPVYAEIANPYGVAVIIGNRSYENERVPEVAYAHRDADAFRRFVLEVLGFDPDNVIDLRDASQAEMESAFGNERTPQGLVWRYLDPQEGSDLVVFYSGHGVPGLKDKRGYLLPVDANPDTAEINGYPIDVLYANLAKLEDATSVQVFLDACFSGDSDSGMLVRSASPVYVQAALPEASGEAFTVLAAASGKEVASWDDEARHGLFTHHLLYALYGAGDADGDGQVTAAEVKHYLDRTMTRAARREFGRLQNASLNGAAHAVLASAGADGTFRSRPAVDGEATEAVAAVKEAAVGFATPEAVGSAVSAAEGSSGSVLVPESVESSLGLSRSERRRIQQGLAASGFEPGPVDGLFGRGTRGAISRWQSSRGEPATGYLDAESAKELLAAAGSQSQGGSSDSSLPQIVLPSPEPSPPSVEEYMLWQSIKGSKDPRDFEKYLTEHPGGMYEKLARHRRDTLIAADDAAYARAQSLAMVEAYVEYRKSHPTGRHARPALAQINMQKAERLARERQPGRRFRDCEGCPEMVVLPLGSYRMGSPPHEEGRDDSEGPMHQVTISKPIAVGRYEVTRGQYSHFVEETGYAEGSACLTVEGGEIKEDSARGWRNPGYRQNDSHPVVCVSWKDAQAYVRWLSKKTGKRYRLLSESEWEYAARAGTSAEAYWGDDPADACSYENFGDAVTMFQVFQKLNEHFGSMQWIREIGSERWQRWVSNQDAGLQTVLGTVFLFLEPEDAMLVALDLYYQHNPARQPKQKLPSSKHPDMEEFLSATKRRLCRDGHADTSPVGSFFPNGFGLYDMLGNVSEWTLDCWNDSYRGAPSDGSAWESAGFVLDKAGFMRPIGNSGDCNLRVLRGGSWGLGFHSQGTPRSAIRSLFHSDYRSLFIGFRVARTFAP